MDLKSFVLFRADFSCQCSSGCGPWPRPPFLRCPPEALPGSKVLHNQTSSLFIFLSVFRDSLKTHVNSEPLLNILKSVVKQFIFSSAILINLMSDILIKKTKIALLDLTLADPTYILPVVTCSTIYLQLYLGADGLNTSNIPPFMKKVINGNRTLNTVLTAKDWTSNCNNSFNFPAPAFVAV